MMRSLRKQIKREDGVALILTLGVLSLLVVLAFSFALAAISAKSGAQLEENITKARMETQSRLQIIYNEMFVDFAAEIDEENLFPAVSTTNGATIGPPGSPYEGRYFWYSTSASDSYAIADAFDIKLAGVNFFSGDTFSSYFPDAGWIPIFSPETGDEMVARYAYVIVDGSGMVDPSALVEPGVDEGAESNRPGLSPTELSLTDVLLDTPLARFFQHEPAGELPADLRWLSYYNIFRTGHGTLTDADHDSILRLTFPYSFDLEAYDDSVLNKHRFNIGASQTAWDNMTIADLDTGTNPYWDGREVTPNSSGIPWLHYGDSRKKYQIMANLIDYNDTDSLPTTDYVQGSDPPTASYCGLEKVPFINELLLTAYIQEQTDDPGTYEWLLAVTPELVNMYDQPLTITNSVLDLAMTIEWQLDEVSQPALPVRMEIEAVDTNSPNSPVTVAARSYFSYAGLGDFVALTEDIGTETELRITSVTIEHMVLIDADGNLLDLVDDTLPSPQGELLLLTDNFKSIHLEVDDPRHNQPIDQWQWVGDWQQGIGGTIGAVNSVCRPYLAGDLDGDGLLNRDHEPAAVEPWDVSTAYIRDSAMQTFWELGCIHRAGAWETLNLKNYNLLATSTSGLADYENGDGNLLSQVKLGDQLRASGRININTYSDDVIRALFHKVAVSSHYDPSLRSDSIVSLSGAQQMADSMLALTQPQLSGTPFRDRGRMSQSGAFVREWEGNLRGQFLSTDAAMESLVGKSVGLTTIRQNYFTVIITTQVIKDIGGVGQDVFVNGIPCRLRRFDPGGDQVMARQRIVAVLYRDAIDNTFDLVRYEYLHE